MATDPVLTRGLASYKAWSARPITEACASPVWRTVMPGTEGEPRGFSLIGNGECQFVLQARSAFLACSSTECETGLELFGRRNAPVNRGTQRFHHDLTQMDQRRRRPAGGHGRR